MILKEISICCNCLTTKNMLQHKIRDLRYTKVVPKLVLIPSRWTCNTIYRNSDETRVTLESEKRTQRDKNLEEVDSKGSFMPHWHYLSTLALASIFYRYHQEIKGILRTAEFSMVSLIFPIAWKNKVPNSRPYDRRAELLQLSWLNFWISSIRKAYWRNFGNLPKIYFTLSRLSRNNNFF